MGACVCAWELDPTPPAAEAEKAEEADDDDDDDDEEEEEEEFGFDETSSSRIRSSLFNSFSVSSWSVMSCMASSYIFCCSNNFSVCAPSACVKRKILMVR